MVSAPTTATATGTVWRLSSRRRAVTMISFEYEPSEAAGRALSVSLPLVPDWAKACGGVKVNTGAIEPINRILEIRRAIDCPSYVHRDPEPGRMPLKGYALVILSLLCTILVKIDVRNCHTWS